MRTKKVSHRAVLTAEQAREVYLLAKSGKMTQIEIARKFKISQPTVSNIANGLVYRNALRGARA